MSRYESFPDIKNKIQVFSSDYYVGVPHFHRSIELIYLKSGSLTATIYVGKPITFSEGDIVFIPSYSPHCIMESSAQTVVMQIPEYFFEEIEHKVSMNYFALQNKEVNQSIYKIISHIGQYDVQDELIVDGLVRILFGIILKEYSPMEIKSHSETHLVAQIIEFLDEHFKENITVIQTAQHFGFIEFLDEHFKENILIAQTAQHFGFSKNYFSKIFNEYFHCNFNTYVNQLRIKYIDDRKNNPDTNLTNLILDSGFKSLSTYYAFMQRLEHGKTMKTTQPKTD